MVDVHNRLQNFNENIAIQGDLLRKSILMCSDVSNDGSSCNSRELQVILFEKCVIFAEIDYKKNERDLVYDYQNHILVFSIESIQL